MILLLIPNLGRGGAQRVFHDQLFQLSKKFEITGCVFNWDGSFSEDRLENIVSLDVPAGKTIPGKLWNFLVRIRRLRQLKKKLGIKVTISHLEGADYINLLSTVADKTICWIHGTKKYDENIEGVLGIIRKRLLIPYLYKRADRIVTVSKGIADELRKNYPALNPSLVTIYNGFDLDKIVARSNEPIEKGLLPVFETGKILITHSRLSQQKNLKSLFQIFKNVSTTTQVKLVIVGDGELRKELLSFCNTINLKYWTVWDGTLLNHHADVFFIGQQSNPFKFLKKSSIYVMTSGWEGFPLALCEALACGLPVISTDCFTGPREIIAPEINSAQPVQEPYYSPYGVLMPLANLNDSMALAVWVKEVENMLGSKNPDVLNESGVNRIKEFALSRSTDQTVNLIQELYHEKEA